MSIRSFLTSTNPNTNSGISYGFVSLSTPSSSLIMSHKNCSSDRNQKNNNVLIILVPLIQAAFEAFSSCKRDTVKNPKTFLVFTLTEGRIKIRVTSIIAFRKKPWP